jgi:hypothetical protein
MDAATRSLVRRRAGECCEYCLMPQAATPLMPFHVDHIIARQHNEDDTPQNLAFACDRCNAFKGANLVSIDPSTGDRVDLFSPRVDVWDHHFRLVDGQVMGLTGKGRATVRLLQMNVPHRVELRRIWQP